MSYEFGWCGAGYVHDAIRQAYEHCAHGEDARPAETTKMLAELLEPLVPVAKAVCAYEACDSGVDDPINELLAALPKLTEAAGEVRRRLAPYQGVAQAAVRQYIAEHGGPQPS